MAEPRTILPAKRLAYAMQAGLLHAVVALSRLAGIDRASACGGWVGRHVLAPLQGKNRTVGQTLAIAFPDRSEAERAGIAAGMWENLGRVAAELGHLDRLDAEALRARVRVVGTEHLERAAARGKGVIIVSGHFGNWELGIPVFSRLMGLRTTIVVRSPNNPGVARWIDRTRTAAGADQQIEKGAAGLRQMFVTLRRGDAVMMLVDQHIGEGIPVPLFGRQAMTTAAPATLSRKLGAALLPYALRRVSGARFELEFLPEIVVAHTDNPDRDAAEATARINEVLEAEIRRAPSHWLWGHARWRDSVVLNRRAERAGVEG